MGVVELHLCWWNFAW